MYSDFTQMAAANPRLTQKERFRQRFMHKLVYYPMAHEDNWQCVGCGRCLESCPIHMNIVKVIKTYNENADGGNAQ
jgi:heterodisulfide reductase subunit C